MARSSKTPAKWVKIARDIGAIAPAPPQWKDCEMVFDVRPDAPAGLLQPTQPGGGVILKDAHGKAVLSDLCWILILAAAGVGFTYGCLFAKGAQGLRSHTAMFLLIVAIIALFDSIFLVLIWKLSHCVLRYIRFGSPKISLSAYPLLLGGEFSVDISELPRGLEQLRLTLRCLGERSYLHMAGNGEDERVTEYYSLHQVEGLMTLDPDRARAKFSSPLPDLPDLATRAGDPYSIFWDLVIRGERRGLDFEARFVIPVFSPTET